MSEHNLDEYQPGQWWLDELGKLWGQHASVTLDTRRAAKVACDFAKAVFAERNRIEQSKAVEQHEITDTERLQFMMERGYWIAWSRDGESCRVFHRNEDGGTGPVMGWVAAAWSHDPRTAIDKTIEWVRA